jgi:bacterioferritin
MAYEHPPQNLAPQTTLVGAPECASYPRPEGRGLTAQEDKYGPSMAVQEKTLDKNSQPFLTDVKTLRERARKNIASGNVTFTYQGDVKKTIEILQAVLATEIVCVLRYTMHAVAATGISSEGVKAEFAQHAKDEAGHMNEVAERINQLGGKPDFNPAGLATRAASEYGTAENLVEMIKENLIAERIAVDHYRELIRYFGNDDPGTRTMLEGILTVEEEHANDMHDLLVAHEGRPMLPG